MHTHRHTLYVKSDSVPTGRGPDLLMLSVRQSCHSQSDYVSLQWKWENRVSWYLKINNPPHKHTHTYTLCAGVATQKSMYEMRGWWLLLTLYCFVFIFCGRIVSLHLHYSCVDLISASCASVVISSCRHEWVLHVDGIRLSLSVQRATVTQGLFIHCCYLIVFALIVGCKLYLIPASVPTVENTLAWWHAQVLCLKQQSNMSHQMCPWNIVLIILLFLLFYRMDV